jgi:glutamyl endopeptidase
MRPLKFSRYDLPMAGAELGRARPLEADISPQAKQLMVAGVSSLSWSGRRLRSVLGNGGLESVVGQDDRIKIEDASLHPWRMIASLSIYPQSGAGALTGSGWFIHPRVLLTAGHCVYDKGQLGGHARKIVVRPGLGGGKEPYGTVTAVKVAALDRWIQYQDADFDVGCIYLSEDLGEKTGLFDLHAPTDAELNNRLVNISGYPVDRMPTGNQYFHANRVQTATARSIYYDVDTFGGQSGSPVFLQDEPGAYPVAIGIHAYGTGRTPPFPGMVTNSGPRLTPDLIETIRAWTDAA